MLPVTILPRDHRPRHDSIRRPFAYLAARPARYCTGTTLLPLCVHVSSPTGRRPAAIRRFPQFHRPPSISTPCSSRALRVGRTERETSFHASLTGPGFCGSLNAALSVSAVIVFPCACSETALSYESGPSSLQLRIYPCPSTRPPSFRFLPISFRATPELADGNKAPGAELLRNQYSARQTAPWTPGVPRRFWSFENRALTTLLQTSANTHTTRPISTSHRSAIGGYRSISYCPGTMNEFPPAIWTVFRDTSTQRQLPYRAIPSQHCACTPS